MSVGRVNAPGGGGRDFADPRLPHKNRLNHAKRQQSISVARRANNSVLQGVRVTNRTITPGSGKAVTGTAATNLFTSAAHGYTVNKIVRFSALTGGAGIALVTDYYILATGLTANDFKVSATPGGTELDFTTDLTAGTVTEQVWALLYGGVPRTNANAHASDLQHNIPGPREQPRVDSPS